MLIDFLKDVTNAADKDSPAPEAKSSFPIEDAPVRVASKKRMRDMCVLDFAITVFIYCVASPAPNA